LNEARNLLPRSIQSAQAALRQAIGAWPMSKTCSGGRLIRRLIGDERLSGRSHS
jgi:hypothetical protein